MGATRQGRAARDTSLSGLPAGLVTFVFTDIEGSTQLLRQRGELYGELLERHRDLLRDAWHAHQGWEISTDGDSFFVAFARTDDAIDACVAAQRSLAVEPWPDGSTVRVRMGIHCGVAWPRAQNYVALAVHQAARVVDVAHGGQIVVTSQVADRAGPRVRTVSSDDVPLDGDAPRNAALLALGRFRLRDFDEPVALLQVVASSLPSDFPPLRAPPADQHNLVVPPNALFGRSEDLVQLDEALASARLLTIAGPGGVGKTRLATEFGLRNAMRWDGGVWFVDLAGIQEAELVPEAIAVGVGVKLEGATAPLDAVIQDLRPRRALVILDNCEHLREGIARCAQQVLQECVDVKVLATSREPLGLREERVWRPRPLPVDGAVAMFMQRAGMTHVDEATRATLAELCAVLDGLPLAIEIAASRCDVMRPEDVLTQLRKRSGPLRSRDPTVAERQHSVDATIAWSHDLLDDAERTAFRRLAVFAGDFGLDAATAAVAEPREGQAAGLVTAFDVPELVWSLASKSLVATELAAGSTRYRMLETVRAFSTTMLERAEESTQVARRLGTFYVEAFGPDTKLDAASISDRSNEVRNLRGLVGVLATEQPELAQLVATMVLADARQNSYEAALAEGRSLLQELPAQTPGRVVLLNSVAFIANEAQLPQEGRRLIDEAIATAARVGRPAWLDGRLEQELGITELLEGNAAGALELAVSALAAEHNDRGRANLLELQMIAAIDLGQLAEARAAGEAALALIVARGDVEATSLLLSGLAEAAWRIGDQAGAAKRQLESLELGMQTGRLRDIAFAFVMAARLAEARGDDTQAVVLQCAADRLLDELGASLYPTDAELRKQLLDRCAVRLGGERFAEARASGSELEVEVGIHMALAALHEAEAPVGLH